MTQTVALPSVQSTAALLGVNHGIPDQSMQPGKAFTFNVPKDVFSFSTPDPKALFLATLADGSPLPGLASSRPYPGLHSAEREVPRHDRQYDAQRAVLDMAAATDGHDIAAARGITCSEPRAS
jgi:hypothetical protein